MSTGSFIMHIKAEFGMMLKKDLIHQYMESIDHYKKVKTKR